MDNDDILPVANLISRVWAEHGPRSEMHVGDLYWAMFHQHRDMSVVYPKLRKRSDGSVFAFFMRSPGNWCDLVIEPGVEPTTILQQVIEVVENDVDDWGGNPPIRIGRRIHGEEIESFLARAGYQRMGFGYPTLEHSLSIERVSPVPDGFGIKSVAESTVSFESRAAAWLSAFPGDERDADDIRSLTMAPGYEAKLDFICESGSGELAAFCTVWFDPLTKTGLFEPVGTVAAFQRRGLGAAMIGEAVVGLKRFGARTAYVRVHSENDRAIAFYRACGFRVACSKFGFEKVVKERGLGG